MIGPTLCSDPSLPGLPASLLSSLCRREAGEKEKENARGMMGNGKREKISHSRRIESERGTTDFLLIMIIHRIHKWRTRGKKMVPSHESEAFEDEQKLHIFLFFSPPISVFISVL